MIPGDTAGGQALQGDLVEFTEPVVVLMLVKEIKRSRRLLRVISHLYILSVG